MREGHLTERDMQMKKTKAEAMLSLDEAILDAGLLWDADTVLRLCRMVNDFDKGVIAIDIHVTFNDGSTYSTKVED
jgi:hypothetical protein